jgi:hypothetical protein
MYVFNTQLYCPAADPEQNLNLEWETDKQQARTDGMKKVKKRWDPRLAPQREQQIQARSTKGVSFPAPPPDVEGEFVEAANTSSKRSWGANKREYWVTCT